MQWGGNELSMLSAQSRLVQTVSFVSGAAQSVTTRWSGAAQSESALCPGKHVVFATGCPGRRWKYFYINLHAKDTQQLNVPMLFESTPSDDLLLTGAIQSVINCCIGEQGVSPPIFLGNAKI